MDKFEIAQLVGKFVARNKDRAGMDTAHTDGQYVYASDRRVMIRVPADKCEHDLPPGKSRHIPAFERNLLNINLAEFVTWPSLNITLPDPAPCKACQQGLHQWQCTVCNGRGEMLLPTVQVLPGRFYSRRDLVLIADLPALEVGVILNLELSPLYFTFKLGGWEGMGLIMPITGVK